ncbi:hypothetical protein [Holophaga foetida]|uniref:hypothetical protein n=1 Tax=Holophaga foetida TaxID=35839 RepID=UPI0002471C8C|nr:hypothetical protein [Holophaga foetida]
MDKKFVLVISVVVVAVLTGYSAGWVTLFGFPPTSPYFGLSWCYLWAVTVCVAQQSSFKTMVRDIASAACGLVYGYLTYVVMGLLMAGGVPPKATFILGNGIVVFVMCLLHMYFLGKTVFSNMPMLLATYAIWFVLKSPVPGSPNNMWLVGCLIFLAGMVCSSLITAIAFSVYGKLFGGLPIPPPAADRVPESH